MLRAHLPSNSSRLGAVLSGSKALVPPRKADCSVPDEPKVSGKTFFLLSFTIIAFILIAIFTLLLYYHSNFHYLFTFLLPAYLLLFFIFLALPIEVNPLSNSQI